MQATVPGIPAVQQIPLQNMQACQRMLASGDWANPSLHEGIVVSDAHFNRVKASRLGTRSWTVPGACAAILECIGLQPSCITQANVPHVSACVKMYCVVEHPSELMIEQQSCIYLLLLNQCTRMSREAAYLLLPQSQCHKLLQTFSLTGKGTSVTLRYRVEGVCVSR